MKPHYYILTIIIMLFMGVAHGEEVILSGKDINMIYLKNISKLYYSDDAVHLLEANKNLICIDAKNMTIKWVTQCNNYEIIALKWMVIAIEKKDNEISMRYISWKDGSINHSKYSLPNIKSRDTHFQSEIIYEDKEKIAINISNCMFIIRKNDFQAIKTMQCPISHCAVIDNIVYMFQELEKRLSISPIYDIKNMREMKNEQYIDCDYKAIFIKAYKKRLFLFMSNEYNKMKYRYMQFVIIVLDEQLNKVNEITADLRNDIIVGMRDKVYIWTSYGSLVYNVNVDEYENKGSVIIWPLAKYKDKYLCGLMYNQNAELMVEIWDEEKSVSIRKIICRDGVNIKSMMSCCVVECYDYKNHNNYVCVLTNENYDWNKIGETVKVFIEEQKSKAEIGTAPFFLTLSPSPHNTFRHISRISSTSSSPFQSR